MGKTDFELPWPRAEAEAYRAADQAVISANEAQLHIIEPLQKADGSRIVIDTSKIPLTGAGSAPSGIVGIYEDITERSRAEEELRESEEKFRLAFTTGPDAFYWATLEDGRIIEVNPVFEDVFGYPRDEVIGKTSLELGLYCNPDDRARMLSEVNSRGYVRDLELQGRRKDGAIIAVSLSVSKVVSRNQRFILGIIKDVTAHKLAEDERDKLQSELQQAQKMESVGRLAGGVAHDFNNLLTAINGYAGFLMEGLAEDDPRREDFREILSAGERAAGLTRQLLAFSRDRSLEPRVLDINAAVGTRSICSRGLSAKTSS